MQNYVKLSASWLNKLRSATKNAADSPLRLSSNKIGNDEANFSHRILLSEILPLQISHLQKISR